MNNSYIATSELRWDICLIFEIIRGSLLGAISFFSHVVFFFLNLLSVIQLNAQSFWPNFVPFERKEFIKIRKRINIIFFKYSLFMWLSFVFHYYNLCVFLFSIYFSVLLHVVFLKLMTCLMFCLLYRHLICFSSFTFVSFGSSHFLMLRLHGSFKLLYTHWFVQI